MPVSSPVEIVVVGVQNISPQNMPLGHTDNYELKIFEKQSVKDTLNLPHQMYAFFAFHEIIKHNMTKMLLYFFHLQY